MVAIKPLISPLPAYSFLLWWVLLFEFSKRKKRQRHLFWLSSGSLWQLRVYFKTKFNQNVVTSGYRRYNDFYCLYSFLNFPHFLQWSYITISVIMNKQTNLRNSWVYFIPVRHFYGSFVPLILDHHTLIKI